MASIISILISPLLLALLLAIIQESQGQSLIPEGLLDFIPTACMSTIVDVALPCAIENLCFSLLPTEEEIASIPGEADIASCADIETALCPITTRCPACKEKADDFFKCVIMNNNVTQDLRDLVNGCPLDCSSILEPPPPLVDPSTPDSVPATETNPDSSAPTEIPVAAESSAPTVTPDAVESSTPTEISGDTESADTPLDSGAVNMMSYAGAIIGGATYFVLGWSCMTL